MNETLTTARTSTVTTARVWTDSETSPASASAVTRGATVTQRSTSAPADRASTEGLARTASTATCVAVLRAPQVSSRNDAFLMDATTLQFHVSMNMLF